MSVIIPIRKKKALLFDSPLYIKPKMNKCNLQMKHVKIIFFFQKHKTFSNETDMRRRENYLSISGLILLYWPVFEHSSDLRKCFYNYLFISLEI